MNTIDEPSVKKEERRAWVSPALKNVGTIGDIVGDEKMSHVGDPGPSSRRERG
jgi:hypothetical protein